MFGETHKTARLRRDNEVSSIHSYRALSADKTSTIGLAVTRYGFNIVKKLDKPICIPREAYEMKLTQAIQAAEIRGS